MIPELRRAYNESFTPEKYEEYGRRLEERGGMEIPFRLAETPVFLRRGLRDEMVSASLDIFRQLSTPEALERSLAAVPPAPRRSRLRRAGRPSPSWTSRSHAARAAASRRS